MFSELCVIEPFSDHRCEECDSRIPLGIAIERWFMDGQRRVSGWVHVTCASEGERLHALGQVGEAVISR